MDGNLDGLELSISRRRYPLAVYWCRHPSEELTLVVRGASWPLVFAISRAVADLYPDRDVLVTTATGDLVPAPRAMRFLPDTIEAANEDAAATVLPGQLRLPIGMEVDG